MRGTDRLRRARMGAAVDKNQQQLEEEAQCRMVALLAARQLLRTGMGRSRAGSQVNPAPGGGPVPPPHDGGVDAPDPGTGRRAGRVVWEHRPCARTRHRGPQGVRRRARARAHAPSE
jgi:hypothetical protein